MTQSVFIQIARGVHGPRAEQRVHFHAIRSDPDRIEANALFFRQFSRLFGGHFAGGVGPIGEQDQYTATRWLFPQPFDGQANRIPNSGFFSGKSDF